ncbi:MAG: SRPBCC domain-containing protein [Caulobacter sp.]|nr:SRPBCC domain-containing protein [Caulobacter sp.]
MLVETEIEIAAPPAKVWRILCDFPAYPRWHPYRAIVGQAALGERLSMMIGPNPADRQKASARIGVFKPEEELAFDSGTFLGRWRETLLFEPTPRGTLLRRRTKLTGLAALVFSFGKWRSNLRSAYVASDKALQKEATANHQAKRPSRYRPRGRM